MEAFNPLTEVIYDRARAILEKEDKEEEEWEAEKKAKRFYRACMDEEKAEEVALKRVKLEALAFLSPCFQFQLGVGPLQNSLNSLLQPGGWPVLKGGRWRDNNFQWYWVTEKLNREGGF